MAGGGGLLRLGSHKNVFVAGKVEEDRVEEELPLRSGHDIPARDRRKGKTTRLVGRTLQTQENKKHHEQKSTTREQHSRGFISSADRRHGEGQPRRPREAPTEKAGTAWRLERGRSDLVLLRGGGGNGPFLVVCRTSRLVSDHTEPRPFSLLWL